MRSGLNIILVVAAMVLVWSKADAQVVQGTRIEFEMGDRENPFNIISNENYGLTIFRQKQLENETTTFGNTVEIIKIDTALQVVWDAQFPIPKEYTLHAYDYLDEYLYLIFNKSFTVTKGLFLLTVDLIHGDTLHHHIPSAIPLEMPDIKAMRDAVLIFGKYNYRDAILHYDLISGQIKALPGFYKNNSEVSHIYTDEITNSLDVITVEKYKNRQFSLILSSFDLDGNQIGKYQLTPDNDYSLIQGRVINQFGLEKIIVGTYTFKRSPLSRGIFMATLDEEGNSNINYYNFADLENFFSYLKPRREKRTKERIARRKEKGKNTRFSYRMLVHEIIPHNDNFIMLGEAFYPKYNNQAMDPYFGMGGYARNTQYIFEGYRYTHAVMIAFDENGKLIWDNSFEINDITSFNLQQFVHATPVDDKYALLYLYENQIRSKLIQNNQVVEGKMVSEVQLVFEDDVLRRADADISGLHQWYDRYFYAFGVQKIKNLSDTNVKLNRRIFYINKVYYQQDLDLTKKD